MDQDTQKLIAGHLRKPEGKMGEEVAQHMNKGNAEMNRFAIKHLQLETGDTLLEIGMGNGFFAAEMLEQISEGYYTGIDYSATMVKAASALNAKSVEQNRMKFMEGKASDLPFEDDSFDKILTVNTIYFWEHPVQELSEIARVLHPKGLFVLAIRPEKTMSNIPLTRFDFHIRKEELIEKFMKEAGLRITGKEQNREAGNTFDGSTMELSSLVYICKPQR